jgi:hypothetical protein
MAYFRFVHQTPWMLTGRTRKRLMKTRLATLAAGLSVALAARAEIVAAANGHFSVQVGSTLEVVDVAGQPLILLDQNTARVRQIEVSWSPDSHRVVVLENTDRGSVVLAAWQMGATWHKAFQTDPMSSRSPAQVFLKRNRMVVGSIFGGINKRDRTLLGPLAQFLHNGSATIQFGKIPPAEFVPPGRVVTEPFS